MYLSVVLSVLLLAFGYHELGLRPPGASPAALATPAAPATYVVDDAGVLSPSFERELNDRLKSIDDSSSVQIVVVAVDTLDGASAGAYALRLGRELGVGQSGLNNGMVVLLAPRERQVHVLVGTGLEWQIPDAESSRVVAAMNAFFRVGNFQAGLRTGVEQLASLATAVSWDVRYRSLQDLPQNRARAVGAILVVQGTPTGDGSTVDVDGEPVRLLFPPYWDQSQPGGDSPITVTGRLVAAAPLTLQVFDAADG